MRMSYMHVCTYTELIYITFVHIHGETQTDTRTRTEGQTDKADKDDFFLVWINPKIYTEIEVRDQVP